MSLVAELHDAAFDGDIDELTNILNRGTLKYQHILITSLSEDDTGRTAIHIAASLGHDNVVRMLLDTLPLEDKYGIVSHKSNDSATPLHSAASGGHIRTVEAILQFFSVKQQNSLISMQTSDGRTALHMASYKGHLLIVRALLENFEADDQYRLISVKDSGGRTAIHLASFNGHTIIVEDFLGRLHPEQQLRLIKFEDNFKHTAANLASNRNHTSTAKVLDLYMQQASTETNGLSEKLKQVRGKTVRKRSFMTSAKIHYSCQAKSHGKHFR